MAEDMDVGADKLREGGTGAVLSRVNGDCGPCLV